MKRETGIQEESRVDNFQKKYCNLCTSVPLYDKRGCLGAPDITVEILSPSTSYKDQTEKLLLYEKHGIKEYWIVNPDAKYVMIYRFEGVKYGKPEYLTENDILESRVLEGLKIDLSEVWA